MKNIKEPFNFNFYTMNNKNRSNYLKYYEPTRLYPSNIGRININLNLYKSNSNLNNKYSRHNKTHNHHYPHKKKDINNFNTNHINKNNINSNHKYLNENLAQMLNNLKKEIFEISNNMKDGERKVDYYLNKNYDNSQKIRSKSENISKNFLLLPKQKEEFAIKGISLDVNSSHNKKKILNCIYNDMKQKTSSNNNNNKRLTYNLYSKKNYNNLNMLTIQLNNENILNKIYNKNKLCNNYVNDIRPKYHTAENFYHHDKRRKQNFNINRKYDINIEEDIIGNLENNSNKISEKSSTYISINQDCKCDSIEKVPKSFGSNIKGNEIENKIGRICCNRENIEKQIYDLQNKMVSSNNIMPELFNSAHSIKKELEILKNENEELKQKINYSNNSNTLNNSYDELDADIKTLKKKNRSKDEEIIRLNKEIQRLNNTINIKNSIINILKFGNNNNYNPYTYSCICNTNNNYNNFSDNNSINSINDYYGNNINGNNNINGGYASIGLGRGNNISNSILNSNIKNLETEISKLRFNLNLQKNNEYLNLQNKNKELIEENLSLKEKINNLIKKHYDRSEMSHENLIKEKDNEIKELTNDKIILEEKIKKIEDIKR